MNCVAKNCTNYLKEKEVNRIELEQMKEESKLKREKKSSKSSISRKRREKM